MDPHTPLQPATASPTLIPQQPPQPGQSSPPPDTYRQHSNSSRSTASNSSSSSELGALTDSYARSASGSSVVSGGSTPGALSLSAASISSPLSGCSPLSPSPSPIAAHSPSSTASPSPSSSAAASSASLSSAWHLERSRRLRSDRCSTVMGAKLSRRESLSGKKGESEHTRRVSREADTNATAMQDSASARAAAPPRVSLPHPSPSLGPVLDIHSPLHSARTVQHVPSDISSLLNGQQQRSTPSSPAITAAAHSQSMPSTPMLTPSKQQQQQHHLNAPSHTATPLTATSRPPHHPGVATVPAHTASSSSAATSSPHTPHTSSPGGGNAQSSPASPIASASPNARRIKSHFALNSHNGYAVPNTASVNTVAAAVDAAAGVHSRTVSAPVSLVGTPLSTASSSAPSPSHLAGVCPLPPLALPEPASVTSAVTAAAAAAAAQHLQNEEQEAILFSPAYVLPPEGGSATGGVGQQHHLTLPVSVNSIQQTVAAQSNVVQTAVAEGHVRHLAAATAVVVDTTAAATSAATAATAAAVTAAAASNAPSTRRVLTTTGAAVGASGASAEEFDPFLFIKHLPPLSQAVRTCSVPVLPARSPSAPRIALALDLDETLVHCSVEPLEKYDLTFNVVFNSQSYVVYVKLRPHLYHFLRTVQAWFEVIVFTASQRIYADKLLNILDADGTLVAHRVFRDSCVCVEGNFLKDLSVLGRPLCSTVILDNSVQAFGFQLDNGIPIESWFDDEADDELLKLLPFLDHIRNLADVRPTLKQTFKLSEFVHSL